IIMEDVDGQKGNLNFKVNSEAVVIYTLAQHANTNFIYQEFIPNDFDYRIVVLGQSRIGSIDKRTRQNLKDHRNNVALGATEFFIEPNEFEGDDLKKLAIDASIACGVEVAGVDIVLSTRNNKAYLMEINSSPGFT